MVYPTAFGLLKYALSKQLYNVSLRTSSSNGLDRRSEPLYRDGPIAGPKMVRAKCHVPTYLGHRDLDLHGPKQRFATGLLSAKREGVDKVHDFEADWVECRGALYRAMPRWLRWPLKDSVQAFVP